MKISGTVRSIIYKNAETGYQVVEVLCQDGTSIVATGKFPTIGAEEILELDGEYVFSNKYGRQFSVSAIEIKKPKSITAIQKYLSSGLIGGVGEATSRHIVEFFGEQTLNIIEHHPEKLAEVKGISLRKAKEISSAYMSIKKMQEAVIFLQAYDISIGLSVKIYKEYKNRTIQILKSNPYKLIEDIDGVGFKTADKIASKLGIEPDSEFRIRAGVLYIITELAEKQGSTVVELSDLVAGACGILGFGEDMQGEVERQVTNLVIEGLIKKIDYCGRDAIISTKNYAMEKSIADKIKMLQITNISNNLNISDLLKAYQQTNDITLAPMQQKAIECAINNPVSIITGGPGTGKTTIIKGLIYIFKSQNKRCMLMAPTGRASKRLEEQTKSRASTIHRALEINYTSNKLGFVHNEHNPLEADCIIVDEVSMLDVFITYSLLKAVKLGTKVVFVGDKDQLPSVGAGNVLGDLIESGVVPYVVLNQIFRQSEDSQIVVNAHKINNGQMPDLTKKSSDFFYCNRSEPNAVLNEIVQMVSTRIPAYKNIKPTDIQVIAPMKSGVAGVDNINVVLQNTLNPPSDQKSELTFTKRIFRVGDKVMQTSNNYNQQWEKVERGITVFGQGVFNGDIGYIDDINQLSSTVYVTFEDGRRTAYSVVELDDLTLSYAITIHKSQGSEFDVVIIPILAGNPKLYNKNLLYTAITRAKKMVVLIGKSGNIFYMVNNKYSETRKTMLKTMLLSDNL